MDTSIKTSDIIQNLIKEIEKLEKEFSEILLNKKNTENELYLFKLDYDSKIAPFYLKKLKIDAQIGEILKTRWISLERFEKDNGYQPEIIDQEWFESQKEYFENQNTEREKIEENIKNMSENDSVEFKKLYKKLAMKFHPDKFVWQQEKQQKALELMKKINNAFQEQDLDQLQRIESEWFDLQDSTSWLDENSLIMKKNDLEYHINNTKLDIEKIQISELYTLYLTYLAHWKDKFYLKIIEDAKNDIQEATKLLQILKEMPL